MKEYLKMDDVFGDVVAQKLIGDAYEIMSQTYGHVCVVNTEERAGMVAHAINSHDELVEVNKELLGALEDVIEYLTFDGFDGRFIGIREDVDLTDWIKPHLDVIAKAKGEAS